MVSNTDVVEREVLVDRDVSVLKTEDVDLEVPVAFTVFRVVDVA